jgi:hypothetical protein
MAKEKKNTIETNFKCEKAKQAKPSQPASSQPKEAREGSIYYVCKVK